MTELKKLDPKTNTFEALGVTYTFEENLSIERYRRFEQFRLEAGFGVSVGDLMDVLRKNSDFLERFAQGEKVYGEMVALNYNTLKGLIHLVQKEPYAVWLCTLFFNTPDEDRRYFKEDIMRNKIIAWSEEGLDMGFFINKACALINSFNIIYENITQLSLGWMPGENPIDQINLDPPITDPN